MNYILNIERGEACIYDDVEINGKIVKISTKRQQHHAHYRKQKQLESIRFDMDKTLNDEIRILKDENIEISPSCTSCENGKFFSYRAEEGKCGRMLTAIGLNRF